MFSSFSSFLPSVLQSNQERSLQSPVQNDAKDNTGVRFTEQPTSTTDDPAMKKKDKKDKNANETFIVVRPPPSKSNHPLNLQVQLVPPHTRNDRYSTGSQFEASTGDFLEKQSSTDLTRTTSNRSEASAYSGYTSAASISSFSSSSTSGRRMIIPLYNLQAHNVMTNTIVDAGTDAKVAKFAKRGLEILNLAILEPVEVWGINPLPTALPGGGSARTSVDDNHRDFGLLPLPQMASPSNRPSTPDRSQLGLMSPARDRQVLRKPSVAVIPSTPPSSINISGGTTPQNGTKKFLGRMFKKRDLSRPLSTIEAGTPSTVVTLRSTSHTRTHSTARQSYDFSPHSEAPLMTDKMSPPPMQNSSSTLCPPVLGIQPALYPPIYPPKGRPTMYVWVVRKWLKGCDNGLLNEMMGKLSINSRSESNASYFPTGSSQVEVRFEWSRGKSGRKRDRERGRKDGVSRKASVAETASTKHGSRRQSAVLETSPQNPLHASSPPPRSPITRTLDASHAQHRQSTISHHSTSTDTGTSDEHMGSTALHEDSGDESDPEDSETPWSCVVSVQRIGSSPLGRSGSATTSTSGSGSRDPHSHSHHHRDKEPGVRIKVATLSPSPHHPKVVAVLKMPFPLPDIEVEKLAVHKRVITSHGVNRMVPVSGELVLTAEEIKDSISSTALWLIVREGFGGVGKVSRKGDGWRIRA